MRLTTLALCAALAFSGCGGGGGHHDNDGGASLQASARRHASQTLTQAAAAPPTTTMAESAEQLMDEAQRRYPTLFPGSQATKSQPPFAYRHYPSTGNYVGVALVSEGPYVAGNVYVLGTSFGDKPVSVGPLTQFVTPKANRITVNLQNNSVVADIARGVFYASVPGSVVGQGNRIATVNATSGEVQYSAPVGSEPKAMALAADGGSLYVALDGSGEVVRLALPGMNKLGSIRLPADPYYGQKKVESLAASPTQPGTFAVAMRFSGNSPRGAGVLLVRDMVAQPRQAAGGGNLITFAPDGQRLYGQDIELSSHGLTRIAIQADGLTSETSVRAHTKFGTRSIDSAGSLVSSGGSLWAAPALLGAGRVSDANDCRFRNATLLLCVAATYSRDPGALLLVDPATATILSALAMPEPLDIYNEYATAVPGPGATVAWREAGRITLVRDEGLR